jgi:uncharacterized alkaline shock family protein YloU
VIEQTSGGVAGPAWPAQVEPADLIAAAVTSVPGVTGLHPGAFGEVATYLPGRRVPGIRLGGSHAEVHVVVAFGAPVLETATAVRDAVQPLVGTPVDVFIEDIDQT